MLQLGDLYSCSVLRTFPELVTAGTMQKGAFLTFNAIRLLLNKIWGVVDSEPPESSLLTIISTIGNSKCIITTLYKALLEGICTTLPNVKARWDAVLPTPLSQETWITALTTIKSVSRNPRLRYTQFNYLHQSYLSPARIQKIYPHTTPTCPRCATPAADFYHMVWECQTINLAWQHVTEVTAEISSHTLVPTPDSCLLGIRHRTKAGKHTHRFIDLGFVVHKRLIATHWKAPHAPSYASWLRELCSRSQAEAQTLRSLQHRGLNLAGLETWDTFVVAMEARDDMYPP
ncbi:hypothetical protein NDU88_002679 [Pleurodeles waltl]|uniref:Reverse transcriptase zinc-binding domain-containing protein n=1 Tax=Pleurodeles waltl TaxID=8319 RepID=A0AAV7VF31_PLEWA|nr:hypothetical protein NDU88_002679 [Pleurodeles waltl]